MIAEISAALASIKTAFDLLKIVQESKKAVSELELQRKLVDIAKALADAEMQIASIQNQLAEKDQKIRELEDKLKLQEEMFYDEPFYFRDIDGKRDGPFCQQCWDKDKEAIRLQRFGQSGSWSCRTCGNLYKPGPLLQKILEKILNKKGKGNKSK